jgi:hypothetical protein
MVQWHTEGVPQSSTLQALKDQCSYAGLVDGMCFDCKTGNCVHKGPCCGPQMEVTRVYVYNDLDSRETLRAKLGLRLCTKPRCQEAFAREGNVSRGRRPASVAVWSACALLHYGAHIFLRQHARQWHEAAVESGSIGLLRIVLRMYGRHATPRTTSVAAVTGRYFRGIGRGIPPCPRLGIYGSVQ